MAPDDDDNNLHNATTMIAAEGPCPYETLGLSPPDFSAAPSSAEFAGPQPADVRRAFRRLALTKHPD